MIETRSNKSVFEMLVQAVTVFEQKTFEQKQKVVTNKKWHL